MFEDACEGRRVPLLGLSLLLGTEVALDSLVKRAVATEIVGSESGCDVASSVVAITYKQGSRDVRIHLEYPH